MSKSQRALNDFLKRRSKIQSSPMGDGSYVVTTPHGVPFLAQSHLREILLAVHQGEAPINGELIHAQMQDPPAQGIATITLPASLVSALSERQAAIILRHLEGILRDEDEGKLLEGRLSALFDDTASVQATTSEDGERLFLITGKQSAADRRRYAERYAEHVASNTLFDVAKALNSQLGQLLSDETRDKYFVEGRDVSDRKIRFGEEVTPELLLTDSGAWLYTGMADKSPHLRETISGLFKQSILNPVGLSVKHYLGKHNVMKAGKRPLVKVPPFSAFFGWVKGLFGSRPPADQ